MKITEKRKKVLWILFVLFSICCTIVAIKTKNIGFIAIFASPYAAYKWYHKWMPILMPDKKEKTDDDPENGLMPEGFLRNGW